MRPRAAALLGFLLLAGQACQAQTSTPPARVEAEPAVRASAALEAGRYAEAVGLFREALAPTPESVALRYGLAVALSYTDRGAAIREFQWVLASAQPGSQERVESQAWLARAGALPSVPTASSRSAEPERQVGNAVLGGRALFAEAGAKPEPMRRLQLFLMGQPDSPTKGERYYLRTDEDGGFKFPNVPPGPYMLTNLLVGQPIWRLRVELKPTEEKQLDLNPRNSVAVRDDFPQPRELPSRPSRRIGVDGLLPAERPEPVFVTPITFMSRSAMIRRRLQAGFVDVITSYIHATRATRS